MMAKATSRHSMPTVPWLSPGAATIPTAAILLAAMVRVRVRTW